MALPIKLEVFFVFLLLQHKKGVLLGVVGTDVPTSHLESVVSKHKVYHEHTILH